MLPVARAGRVCGIPRQGHPQAWPPQLRAYAFIPEVEEVAFRPLPVAHENRNRSGMGNGKTPP